MELRCNVGVQRVNLISSQVNQAFGLQFIEVLLHSGFELLLCVSHVHFSCVVAFDCCQIPACLVMTTCTIS